MAKRGRGRPRKEIDQAIFEKLCGMFNTQEDICHVFEVDEMTLVRWCKRTYGQNFEGAYKRFSAGGRVSLRRMQFQSAQKGNVTMQIWLGKQNLKQSDNPAADDSREVPAPVFSIVRREA